jgi:hypothetical protein
MVMPAQVFLETATNGALMDGVTATERIATALPPSRNV